MYHIYVYNFGAGQKKWCSTCYRCNSQFGAYEYFKPSGYNCIITRLRRVIILYSKSHLSLHILTMGQAGLRPILKSWASGPPKTPDSRPGLGPDPSLVYKVRFQTNRRRIVKILLLSELDFQTIVGILHVTRHLIQKYIGGSTLVHAYVPKVPTCHFQK